MLQAPRYLNPALAISFLGQSEFGTKCKRVIVVESGIILVPDSWTSPDYDFCNSFGPVSDLDIAKIFRNRTGFSNFNIRTTLSRTYNKL